MLASMLTHAALLIWGIQRNSITFDEYWHVSAGAAYWKYGEFSICGLSPPLLRLWAAAPFLLGDVKIPPIDNAMRTEYQSRHAVYAVDFEQANYARLPQLYEQARYALIPVSLIGLWITARWASELFGPAAGCAAAVLYALCPNILAHAGLATTDIGTTTAMLAALWLWSRCCRRPTLPRAFAAAVAVGAAHLCKFTALLLWPALIAIGLLTCFAQRHRLRQVALPISLSLLTVIAASPVLINVGYAFRSFGSRLDSFTFKSKSCQSLAALPGWLPLPLPRDFVEGFDEQKWTAESRPASFMLGRLAQHNNFLYYAVALGCKLPLATLTLIALAGVSALLHSRRSVSPSAHGATEPVPDAPSALSVAASLLILALGMILMSNFNIGLRYILPIFPLGFILLSSLWTRGRPLRLVGGILLGALMLETLAVAPRYLTFFNAAVGGPSNGWKLLSDSNVDWGQGLRDLKDWMDAQPVEQVQLWHFGFIDPGVYGIRFCPPRGTCRDEYVAVSVCPLVGLAPIPEMRLPWHRELAAKPRVAIVGNTFHIFTREAYEDARREYEYAQLK